jgi:hypothetical protein
MSRRLPVTAIANSCPQLSRRLVLQRSTSASLFSLPVSVDAAEVAGAHWLARHFEIAHLGNQWSELETRLIREYDWFNLSRLQRNLFTEALELDALSDRMDALDEENLTAIAALANVRAVSENGIERKLEVAEAFLPVDENAHAHRLIASILCDFRALFMGGGKL